MSLAEIIENLPGWAKITGVGLGSLGFIFLIIFLVYISHQPGGEEVINIPSNLSDIKENVTQTLKDTAIETSSNVAGQIVNQFSESGKELSKDVQDPVAKKGIESNMTLAGIMLALILVIALCSAFWKVIQAIGKSLPF